MSTTVISRKVSTQYPVTVGFVPAADLGNEARRRRRHLPDNRVSKTAVQNVQNCVVVTFYKLICLVDKMTYQLFDQLPSNKVVKPSKNAECRVCNRYQKYWKMQNLTDVKCKCCLRHSHNYSRDLRVWRPFLLPDGVFARQLMTRWIAQLMDPVHAGSLRHDHHLTNMCVTSLNLCR